MLLRNTGILTQLYPRSSPTRVWRTRELRTLETARESRRYCGQCRVAFDSRTPGENRQNAPPSFRILYQEVCYPRRVCMLEFDTAMWISDTGSRCIIRYTMIDPFPPGFVTEYNLQIQSGAHLQYNGKCSVLDCVAGGIRRMLWRSLP